MRRHASLADQLKALMAFKNRPEGRPIPVKTNWSVVQPPVAAPEELAEYRAERIIRMTPSVAEIMRNVRDGNIERNADGQIVRIGKLRFSDGTQYEAGYKRAPGGGVVAVKHRMPAGAMLGVRDTQDRMAGSGNNRFEEAASNLHFADMFGVKPRRRQAAAERRNGPGLTHEQRKAALAEAYANTPSPPVTKYPPGLPAAGQKVADSFLGMQKARCADSGATKWESISTAIVDREIWAAALDELAERDRLVLDAVAHGRARNYADLGVTIGMKHEYARRKGGKRAVEAANDNLQEKLKKFTA
jgi:hypothetical protein